MGGQHGGYGGIVSIGAEHLTMLYECGAGAIGPACSGQMGRCPIEIADTTVNQRRVDLSQASGSARNNGVEPGCGTFKTASQKIDGRDGPFILHAAG